MGSVSASKVINGNDWKARRNTSVLYLSSGSALFSPQKRKHRKYYICSVPLQLNSDVWKGDLEGKKWLNHKTNINIVNIASETRGRLVTVQKRGAGILFGVMLSSQFIWMRTRGIFSWLKSFSLTVALVRFIFTSFSSQNLSSTEQYLLQSETIPQPSSRLLLFCRLPQSLRSSLGPSMGFCTAEASHVRKRDHGNLRLFFSAWSKKWRMLHVSWWSEQNRNHAFTRGDKSTSIQLSTRVMHQWELGIAASFHS